MADPRSEPSMEDILASIKRIIADDGPLPRRNYGGAPASSVAPPPVVPPAPAPARMPPAPVFPSAAAVPPPIPASRDESVLELTNIAPSQRGRQPWPPAEDRPDPRGEDDIPAQRRAIERLRQSEAASAHARAASMAAVAPEPALAAEPLPPASKPEPTIAAAAISGLTVEALVREMLRPMLSEWIDTHMPAIVERLVKQEISGQEDAG